MSKYSIHIFLAALIHISVVLGAGNITVNSTVDQDRILIGDVITYSVIVERDADVDVLMPALAQNLGMFEIRDYEVLEPQKIDDKIVEQTNYLISTFDTGDYVIPELEINYRVQGDSTWQVIKTQAIDVYVESLNPDEAGDIRDIKPPLTPPRDYRRVVLMGILALLIIAAIIFVIYYIKRMRQGEPLIPKRSKPPRPAHEVALEALEKLKNTDLLAQGKAKDYYTELSDIVRQYIEDRYFIPALEMTTTQLLFGMGDQDLDTQSIDTIQAILMTSDLVKFARFVPAAAEHEKNWQLAYEFVDKTKLVFEPITVSEKADEENEAIVVEEAESVSEKDEPLKEEEKDV